MRGEPTVFLSYAREDAGIAQRLYEDLRGSGVDVWFDQRELAGGQDWKATVGEAIEDSRFFLALLSANSVGKTGFCQKELKMAFNILGLHPTSDIYLIPVRVSNCDPREEEFRNLHWIDLFPDSQYYDGLKEILRSIRGGLRSLRHLPTQLSKADVYEMVIKKGFYDKEINPSGEGLPHSYRDVAALGDAMVIDYGAGLVWQKSGSKERMDYECAEAWVDDLNYRNHFGGHYDWRIPTLEEAMSLLEPRRAKGPWHVGKVFGKAHDGIWSADSHDESTMWVVNLRSGHCWVNLSDGEDLFVKAVRSLGPEEE